tara:strand:+ start:7315 stop:7506 length:192 start_codon:yes stop_codon:yes gene_type:complete
MPDNITAPFIEQGILGLGWPIAIWLGVYLLKFMRGNTDKLIEVIRANTEANTLLAQKIDQATK